MRGPEASYPGRTRRYRINIRGQSVTRRIGFGDVAAVDAGLSHQKQMPEAPTPFSAGASARVAFKKNGYLIRIRRPVASPSGDWIRAK